MKTPAFLSLSAATLAAVLALVGVEAASSAWADENGYRDDGYRDDGYRDDGYRSHHDHDDHDHDRARRALQAGDILPLAEILAHLAAVLPGRVIETELEVDDGRHIYEFTVVTPDGRLMEAEVDAATGRLIDLEDED